MFEYPTLQKYYVFRVLSLTKLTQLNTNISINTGRLIIYTLQ
jgi:hypothetical protein